MNKYLTLERRKWIYRVILAAQPLVVFYGLMESEEVALWVSAISAALGVGVASANMGNKKEEKEEIVELISGGYGIDEGSDDFLGERG